VWLSDLDWQLLRNIDGLVADKLALSPPLLLPIRKFTLEEPFALPQVGGMWMPMRVHPQRADVAAPTETT
jgi:hypothetical protein